MRSASESAVRKSSAAPCNSDVTGSKGSHSACCDESKQEACLSTGLCYATQRNDNITFWAEGMQGSVRTRSEVAGQYWRGNQSIHIGWNRAR